MEKILIDLIKMRDYDGCKTEGIYHSEEFMGRLQTIREEATFEFTCRRCNEAPCVKVCPAEALEKDNTGKVARNVNLCVRCKSCINICPFGTLMDDLFDKKIPGRIYDLNDHRELELFLKTCPQDTVMLYEGEEDPSKHIFKLNEKVLVREYIWNS